MRKATQSEIDYFVNKTEEYLKDFLSGKPLFTSLLKELIDYDYTKNKETVESNHNFIEWTKEDTEELIKRF